MFSIISCIRSLKGVQYSSISRAFSITSRYKKVVHVFVSRSYCKGASDNDVNKKMVVRDLFNQEKKNKDTFLSAIDIYTERSVHRHGQVEFIYAALRHMQEYGVENDLQIYKALMNILPKGKYIARNIFQVEFMHYPKQQQCIIDLLEKMEENGVMPDKEMQDILINTFGNRAYPLRKYWRMMYWMPKFKNLTPWPLPTPLPMDSLELAILAIKRICSVDLLTDVTVYQTADIPDSLDKTWIVSGQSPVQKELLATHPDNIPVYIEGAFRVWLRDCQVNYFIMRTDFCREFPEASNPDDVSNISVILETETKRDRDITPTVHEQEDGMILAVCATGSSSRDSLLSWVRHLERDGNQSLNKIPVLFTLKSPIGDVALNSENETT